MATDGHGGEFVPAGPTHDLGYEPDKFAVKTILTVPAAVIVTGIIAFVVTDLIFGAFFAPKHVVIPPEVPAGAVRNAAPINERFDRISSTDPKAEVRQPRLEGLVERQSYGKDGNPKNPDASNVISPEMITTQPTPKGNSPRYHADDLRPERVPAVADPKSDPAAGVNRVPVDKAIELATDPKNAAWAKALPAAKGALPLDLDPNWDRPKESNGGNAKWPAAVPPTQPKKEGGPEAKKGGPTEKEPDKKEPEKKEPEKKEPGKQ